MTTMQHPERVKPPVARPGASATSATATKGGRMPAALSRATTANVSVVKQGRHGFAVGVLQYENPLGVMSDPASTCTSPPSTGS